MRFYDGPISAEEARRVAGPWVEPEMAYGTAHGEWAYLHARKLILAEESLAPEGTDLPDYKFLVFDGNPILCSVIEDRFGQRSKSAYTLPSWKKHEGSSNHSTTVLDPPDELPAMLEAAARLGSGYDFIRVDLYARDNKVWLGELTPYPDIGLVRLDPPEYDEWLGSHWILPRT